MCNEYMLTFSSLEILNNREKHGLLGHFKSAEAIFSAPLNDLLGSGLINKRKAFLLYGTEPDGTIKKKIDMLGVRAVSIMDESYPATLRDIYDPPLVLYIKGEIPDGRRVAVVGSRNCSPEAGKEAFELGCLLAENGLTVVSGMARGIDTAAHRGALKKGRTMAVLGTGSDICYPGENAGLKKEIEGNGCTVSEYPPGTKPTRYTFPARNRIVSGLSEFVILGEAGERSGALITADFALEHGKDVFVLCPRGKARGKGAVQLIEEGAPQISVEGIMNGDLDQWLCSNQ